MAPSKESPCLVYRDAQMYGDEEEGMCWTYLVTRTGLEYVYDVFYHDTDGFIVDASMFVFPHRKQVYVLSGKVRHAQCSSGGLDMLKRHVHLQVKDRVFGQKTLSKMFAFLDGNTQEEGSYLNWRATLNPHSRHYMLSSIFKHFRRALQSSSSPDLEVHQKKQPQVWLKEVVKELPWVLPVAMSGPEKRVLQDACKDVIEFLQEQGIPCLNQLENSAVESMEEIKRELWTVSSAALLAEDD